MNTTVRGNAFRELVGQVLRAAGFVAETEVRVGYKNVDVGGVLLRDELAGPVRYAFEAKDYTGTLPLSECTQFVNDHQPLVRNEAVDHAWLISKGALSPSGRQAVDTAGRGMKAMTFAELQRRLLLLDPYLMTLVGDHEKRQLARYYIRPETPGGEDLETLVRDWMAGPDEPPLFVLGPYGKGKSTFATHLAAVMAREALDDATGRVPILVRLGEIADEQSIDGLLGKVLASQHRVTNYHFETFRALNAAGRFLVIYDGFDEMKHGLTHAKFQQVLGELMRLDEGEARILVLGRDTAFHDEVEFRAVMGGIQVTGAGRDIPAVGRRPYRHVEIRGFTPAEARNYVRRFLPIRAAEERSGPATDSAWVDQRIGELVGGRFDRLLERPVHAQMLCEIAVQPDHLRPDMSVYELFDSFVHYLLQREVEKRGRDRDFPVLVRRRFNASLAWWLWERGGASTTTLADIPQSLCDDSTKGLRHSLGPEEMRRELIQGCLVEKGANTIYFHRSLQEFLVAEHLIETDLLQRTGSNNWLIPTTEGVTPEVVEFVVAGAQVSPDRRKRALGWFDDLADARADRVPLAGFDLFPQLARGLDAQVQGQPGSPWIVWLTFLLRSGGRDFAHRGRNTFPVLADLLVRSRAANRETQAAALYALARTLFHPTAIQGGSVTTALAATLPVKRLREAVEDAQARKSERQIIRYDDDFMLWAVLRSWRVEQGADKRLMVVVDVSRLHHDVLGLLPGGFDRDWEEAQETVTVPVQSIYQALSAMRPAVGEKDIDAIRPFFNDPEVRRLISPVQVERRQTFVPAVAVERPERPLLKLRKP